jgi:hypothetical protein
LPPRNKIISISIDIQLLEEIDALTRCLAAARHSSAAKVLPQDAPEVSRSNVIDALLRAGWSATIGPPLDESEPELQLHLWPDDPPTPEAGDIP